MILIPCAGRDPADYAYCKGIRVRRLKDLLSDFQDDIIITPDHNGNLAIMREDGVTQKGYIDLATDERHWGTR